MEGSELLRHLGKISTLADYDVQLYSIDNVYCPPEKYPALFVFNTASSRGVGEHYISFIVKTNEKAFYYDSFGISPLRCITEFLDKIGVKNLRYSTRWLQSPFSKSCGHHQIAFAACLSAGVDFQKFIDTFSGDYEINDRMVESFVDSL